MTIDYRRKAIEFAEATIEALADGGSSGWYYVSEANPLCQAMADFLWEEDLWEEGARCRAGLKTYRAYRRKGKA